MSGIFGRFMPVMHAAAKNAFPYRNPTPTRKSASSVSLYGYRCVSEIEFVSMMVFF